MAQDADNPQRTELSSDPADYLTGPTSGRSRQGGTTRDGGVAYVTGTPREDDESVATVEANNDAAQTDPAPNTGTASP